LSRREILLDVVRLPAGKILHTLTVKSLPVLLDSN